MEFDWRKLQNGSDIRGVAIEGIKDEKVNLDTNIIEILGMSLVKWLENKDFNDITVAIGMDSRISGPDLKAAFSNGVTGQGANVIDCDLASTPAMFMTTISSKLSVDAAVMLTASHLPFNRNGLKFFTKDGGLDKKDITEIIDLAAQGKFEENRKPGEKSKYDFISDYSKILVQSIREKTYSEVNFDKPLEGLKIIVDAGNGAGGFFAYKVLVPLGADIEGSQFLDPDGNFPNHIPNPENQEAMESICEAVKRTKADLGIIFDTDVDRAAVVDHMGNPINRNALVALISAIVLEEHPGTTIVTDSITSEGLAWFINEKLKGKHHRFKRGYKNVINEAIRLNEEDEASCLAIETSGHAALKENYFLDDGAYLVAKILIKLAQMRFENRLLTDLIKELPVPAESKEYRLSIKCDDFLNYGQNVLEIIGKMIFSFESWSMDTVNYEGVRVRCENDNEQGWFLFRMSLHDPVIPVNIESNVKGGIQNIVQKLKKMLAGFSDLDLSALA